MDDRDRAAPVALARHQPVAQPPHGGGMTGAHLRQALADLALCGLDVEAVEEVRIDDRAVLGIGGIVDFERGGIFPPRAPLGGHPPGLFSPQVQGPPVLPPAAPACPPPPPP